MGSSVSRCRPVPGITGGTVPAVYLVPFHRAEQFPGLRAAGSAALRRRTAPGVPATWTGTRRWAGCAGRTGQELAPGQQQAVQLALTSKVAVLTGGPGCGKSFTVRSIVELAGSEEGQRGAGRPRPGEPPNAWPN